MMLNAHVMLLEVLLGDPLPDSPPVVSHHLLLDGLRHAHDAHVLALCLDELDRELLHTSMLEVLSRALWIMTGASPRHAITIEQLEGVYDPLTTQQATRFRFQELVAEAGRALDAFCSAPSRETLLAFVGASFLMGSVRRART